MGQRKSLRETRRRRTCKTRSLASLKPAFRKARTKIKKPKFLSLSKTTEKMHQNDVVKVHVDDHHQDRHHDADVADIFTGGDSGPTTLTELLNNAAVSEEGSAVSSLVQGGESRNFKLDPLVRTAMRSRERDVSEDRWVSMEEVVERGSVVPATPEEEVTSGGLCLKLDYKEVLNAWSGKGPAFCIEEDEEAECPQTVPDLNSFDNLIPQYGLTSSARTDGQWRVPENNVNGHTSDCRYAGSNIVTEDGWKIGLREASVLRYKEKRQSRLFAKRIRYEVRKLNAEKRPRIKGRFVKKCEG